MKTLRRIKNKFQGLFLNFFLSNVHFFPSSCLAFLSTHLYFLSLIVFPFVFYFSSSVILFILPSLRYFPSLIFFPPSIIHLFAAYKRFRLYVDTADVENYLKAPFSGKQTSCVGHLQAWSGYQMDTGHSWVLLVPQGRFSLRRLRRGIVFYG